MSDKIGIRRRRRLIVDHGKRKGRDHTGTHRDE